MAAENVTTNGAAEQEQEKVQIGDITLVLATRHLAAIKGKIGDLLEAQIIFRGSENLGYGRVVVTDVEPAASEEGITGKAILPEERAKRTRAPKKNKNKGRARRSADDVDDEPAATSEEAAQNGQTSVKAVVEGVEKINLAAGATSEEGAVKKGGKAKKGAAAGGARPARQPRQPKEKGEPSKTLVFIRNLPYSYSQEALQALFAESDLKVTSCIIPVWKYGHYKGKGRGYAFVNLENEQDQQKAIETLNGREIGGASEPAPTAEGAEGAEGAKPASERKFKLVVRQGYEGDEKHDDEHAENAQNDSGTAETSDIAVTDKDGNATQAESVVVAS